MRSHRDIAGGPAKGVAPPRQLKQRDWWKRDVRQVDALPLVRFTAGRRLRIMKSVRRSMATDRGMTQARRKLKRICC